MKRALTLAILFASAASASAITIDTVFVGNPGNAADTSGFGSVAYSYRIGTYEVTNAQYVDFLNSVDPTGANALALYSSNMSTFARGGINYSAAAASGTKFSVKAGRANNPVVFVSWYDTLRFANWLHNGQGSGNTEDGAYTLLGGSPIPSNSDSITRKPGARWWLPSEDEWFKAAYHKNDGVTANYWDYPTSTDNQPYSDQPPGLDAPDKTNTVNYANNDGIANNYDDGFAISGSPTLNNSINYLSNVGAYNLSVSPYGTFDQAGNVSEWTEAKVGQLNVTRAGDWNSRFYTALHADYRFVSGPTGQEFETVGFRVANIPEPSGAALAITILAPLACRRFRR